METSLKRSIFPSAGNSRGSILIIVLWSITLLSVFAVILGYGVRQKLSLVGRLEERGKARHIHDGVVYKAMYALIVENQLEKVYDWLGDDWSSNTAEFKDINIGGGTCSVYYDYVDAIDGSRQRRYGLIDEERKVNINIADRTILERLFSSGLGLNESESAELAACIVDWRDSDSMLSTPTGSAEDSYYRNTEFSYEAKDAPFDVLDEVLLVKGMTPGVFEKIRDYITVYGSGKININTAPRQVIAALGLPGYIMDDIVEFRAGKDGIHGTGDDETFDSPLTVAPIIQRAFKLKDSEVASLVTVSEAYLSTASTAFTVKSHVILNNKLREYSATSVIDKKGKILYWSEGLYR